MDNYTLTAQLMIWTIHTQIYRFARLVATHLCECETLRLAFIAGFLGLLRHRHDRLKVRGVVLAADDGDIDRLEVRAAQ
jgi:hypothetical protein